MINVISLSIIEYLKMPGVKVIYITNTQKSAMDKLKYFISIMDMSKYIIKPYCIIDARGCGIFFYSLNSNMMEILMGWCAEHVLYVFDGIEPIDIKHCCNTNYGHSVLYISGDTK